MDLGGTKIELVALERETERWRKRIPTPKGDYRGTIDAIVSLDREATEALGQQGTLGIGCG